MVEIAIILNRIANTSGKNDKLYLLKKNEHLTGLKPILRFIYNPYNRTGISEAKLNKGIALRRQVGSQQCISYEDAIAYFSKNTTGSDADAVYAAEFIHYTNVTYGKEAAAVAKAIVTQNLKIGVNAASLNIVYGNNFIPKTGCMLGTLYGDVGPTKTKWPCIVTEKLDGIRRVLVKQDGVCKLYSRSGHEDTGLVDIVKEAAFLPDNTVYDGELLAIGNFKDNIALRQATNSIANSKGIKTGLTFNVFDMLLVDEFYAGISEDDAKTRKILLGATLMDESIQYLNEDWARLITAFGTYCNFKYIKPVPILGLVNSIREVDTIVAPIWERGGEGVMLNTTVGKYEIKRSKHLLKVKHTEEAILEVAGMLEGDGKYEGSMGALLVKYKDQLVGVGSGFTDSQRATIWANQAKYIGKKVEIETFGESTNAAGTVSLNCPIFKRFVGDEE